MRDRTASTRVSAVLNPEFAEFDLYPWLAPAWPGTPCRVWRSVLLPAGYSEGRSREYIIALEREIWHRFVYPGPQPSVAGKDYNMSAAVAAY